MKGSAGWRFGLGALVLVALFCRLAYLRLLGDYIGADEAVGGLMALKIAQGRDFPLLLWEAQYGGTLLSYLGALLFGFFEPSPFVFRLTALPLALVGIIAVAVTARALWGPGPALVAAFWLAVGPPLLYAVSGQAIGGYPEVLAFGGLTLWLGVRLCRRPSDHQVSWEWAWLGVVGGFGTYSLAFTLPIFAGTLWTIRRRHGGPSSRQWGVVAAGFLLGFSPFLVYNATHGGASALRLAGRVLDVSRAELGEATSPFLLILHKGLRHARGLLEFPRTFLENLPVFLGLSPWGAWGASAAVLGGLVVTRRRRALPAGDVGLALLGWCGLATLLFISSLGLDAPRHLFPCYLLASLGLAALWNGLAGPWRALGACGVGVLLLSNAAATAREARAATPRVAPLVRALEARDVGFVYTDYFTAYPLLFLSRERILASPAAGPVNVERRPAYTEAVAASLRPAYVFRRNTEASAVFAREMHRHGYGFARAQVDAFDLYLPDRHLRPTELALERQFAP